MKKLLVLSAVLLTLSLSACGNSTPKDTSKDDEESSEEEYSQEDRYLNYPDDKENYYVPKYATYEKYRETTIGTNPDGSLYSELEFNVIINNDEFYAVMYPGNKSHEQMFYCKGKYIPVNGLDHTFSWVYDVYMKAPNQGYEDWKYLLTGEVSIALSYFYSKELFNFHYMKDEYSSTKTGKTLTIEGEELDEYYHKLAGLYVYYSKKDDVLKAYKTVSSTDGTDKYYTKHYMVNYKTEPVEITDKPGPDVLRD